MEQIDYTDQKPWSPITFGRALALAENEHEQFRLWLQVNSNHREISTTEIDTEKPTYSEPCPLQIGFGAEKPIPHTLKKLVQKKSKRIVLLIKIMKCDLMQMLLSKVRDCQTFTKNWSPLLMMSFLKPLKGSTPH